MPPPGQIRISAVSVTSRCASPSARCTPTAHRRHRRQAPTMILRLDHRRRHHRLGARPPPGPSSPGSPEAPRPRRSTIYLRPLLLGADPFRIEALLAQADRTVVHCTEAKAAMEMALFDIVGKALGTPVCNLLGGRVRDEIPLSFSVANPDFSQGRRPDPPASRRRQHTAVQGEDRLRRPRRGPPPPGRSYATCCPTTPKSASTTTKACSRGKAIRRLRDIEHFRAPPSSSNRLLRRPARRPRRHHPPRSTPLSWPTKASSPPPDVRCSSPATTLADLIAIKAQKAGGMLRAREIAAIAAAGGLACYGGDMCETGIAGTAGAAHMIATTTQNTSRSAASSTSRCSTSPRICWRSRSQFETARYRCRPARASAFRWTRIAFAATRSDTGTETVGVRTRAPPPCHCFVATLLAMTGFLPGSPRESRSFGRLV